MSTIAVHYSDEGSLRRARFQKSLAVAFALQDTWLYLDMVYSGERKYALLATGVRLFYITLAFLTNRLRSSRRFYIPGLSEMSEETFWTVTFTGLIIQMAVYLYFLTQFSIVVNTLE